MLHMIFFLCFIHYDSKFHIFIDGVAVRILLNVASSGTFHVMSRTMKHIFGETISHCLTNIFSSFLNFFMDTSFCFCWIFFIVTRYFFPWCRNRMIFFCIFWDSFFPAYFSLPTNETFFSLFFYFLYICVVLFFHGFFPPLLFLRWLRIVLFLLFFWTAFFFLVFFPNFCFAFFFDGVLLFGLSSQHSADKKKKKTAGCSIANPLFFAWLFFRSLFIMDDGNILYFLSK